MDAAHSQPFFRRGPLYSYAAYSIVCFIVWGIIWAIYLLGIAKTNALGTILAIFLGWVIGWTSATIARYVYPPPKKLGAGDPASGLHGR